MNGRTLTWLQAGLLCLVGAASAYGHNGATGVVADRMMAMMMLGEQVKALNPMFVGETAVDPAAVKKAAGMIEMHAGRAMTSLFPEGSLDKPSEAKPEIWTQWPQFQRLAERLLLLGRELAQAAETNAEATTASVQTEPPPQLTEWERLDTAVLLGTAPRPGSAASQLGAIISSETVASLRPAARREPGDVFREIVATCSSCHAAFRK
jgi:cytochrome c556